MPASCYSNRVRLFVSHSRVQLCGIAILAVGITTILKLGDISGADNDLKQMYVASLLCIVLGSVIFLIAFFGCCGAINESRCMTSMVRAMPPT